MNKLEIYRLLHFSGIFTLLFAFGAMFAGKSSTKGAAIGHGIGLVLILVSGFGMQAVYQLGFPSWLIIKLVIWLALGGCLVLAKRRIVNGVAAWILIIALALCAAYLGRLKSAAVPKISVTEASE
jgi:hypothetical protein